MRLFVAVNLPEHERQNLFAATEPLRAAGFPLKHTAADSLHLTLKFLGQVEDDAAEAIGASLEDAVKPVRSFDLGLGDFGAFPDLRLDHPRVIWVGVERHPALELLANDIERAVSRHGFEPELRPFSPHVTIARVRKDAAAEDFEGLEAVLERLTYGSVIPVESVDLMESRSESGGPKYRLVRAAPLVVGG